VNALFVALAFASITIPSIAAAEDHPEGAHSVIESHAEGTVGTVKVRLDIQHGYPGDLVARLEHDGVAVDLFSRPHHAEQIAEEFTLEEFRGHTAGGEWILIVLDEGASDAGTLDGWHLEIEECFEGSDRCLATRFENTTAIGIPDAATFGQIFSSVEFWGSIVNFALLVFILVYFGRKPVKSFLVERRRLVEEDLVEAQRLKEEAERKYEEYAGRLEKLDQELETLRKEMVKAGEEERDRIVAEAEAKAARIRRDTQFLIDQQMKQLRVDLTREAVDAAVSAAEKALKDKVTSVDQERLANDYVARLRGGAS
jgi:F0F1-type ATP synthase membrane subunit b/b'/subtilisin-like proprotein convertase family protein